MRSKWWQKLQKLGTRMKISVRTHSAHIWINAQPKSLETTLWLMKRESLDLHVLSVMGNSTKLHDLNKRWLNQERILHISAVNSSSLPQARSAHWLVKRGWSCSGAATRIICVFNDVISLVVNDAWWVSMMPCGVDAEGVHCEQMNCFKVLLRDCLPLIPFSFNHRLHFTIELIWKIRSRLNDAWLTEAS